VGDHRSIVKKRGGKVIIVGEVRHPHVADALLDAQASGHAGMSTFHAHSPQEAIYRLQQLLLRTGSFPSLVTAKMELALWWWPAPIIPQR